MTHDPKINDAEDGYLGIWNRAEKVPDRALAVLGHMRLDIGDPPPQRILVGHAVGPLACPLADLLAGPLACCPEVCPTTSSLASPVVRRTGCPMVRWHMGHYHCAPG